MSSHYSNEQEPLQNKENRTSTHINKLSQKSHSVGNNKSLQEFTNFDDSDKVPFQIEESNDNLKTILQIDRIKSDNEEFIPLHVKECYDNVTDANVNEQLSVSTIPEELVLIEKNVTDNDNKETVSFNVIIRKDKYMEGNDNLDSLQFHEPINVRSSFQIKDEMSSDSKKSVENENLKVCSNLLEVNNFSNNEVINNSEAYGSIPNVSKDVCNFFQNEQMCIDTFSDTSYLQNQSMNNNMQTLRIDEIRDNVNDSLLTDKINVIKNENVLKIDNISNIKKALQNEEIFINNIKNNTEIQSTDKGISDQTSLFDNKPKVIKTEELLQTKAVSDIQDTLQIKSLSGIKNNTQSLMNDTINFSNEKVLEITNNLKHRDIYLYEHIFFSSDDEDSLEIKQKKKDDTKSLLCYLNVTNDVTIGNDSDVINDEKSLPIENTNCLLNNQTNVNSNQVLQVEENSCFNETNVKIPELINLVYETSNKELSSTVFDIKDTLPKVKSKVVNAVDHMLTDEANLSNNKEFVEFNNFEKPCQVNQTSVSNDIKTDTKVLLENKKVNVRNSVNQSLDTMEKNISDKQPSIINKLQSMNWLKTRSTFDPINMNLNSKLTLKSLTKKDERIKDYFCTSENLNNRKHRSNNSVQNRNQNEIKESDPSNAQVYNNTQQSSVTASKNAWSSINTTKNLFPNSQSIMIDRAKENEEMSFVLAESICTAQQENENRKMTQMSLKTNVKDDYDDNYWGKVQQNLPDNISAEDLNSNSVEQNIGKGFVDKFGRVDGYNEKRLFMGKGARKKEQEFLRAHTENKSRLQNNSGFLQSQPSTKKSALEPNFQSRQEIKKEANLNQNERQTETKIEIALPNRNHGRSAREEFNLPESDLLINKNHKKSGFCHGMSKDLNHSCKEDILKHNQDLIHKTQNNTGINQSHSYQNPNFPDRGQEYNKNQEYITRHHSTSDRYQENINKNQEHFSRHQNYSDKNHDNGNRRQDNLSRNPNYYDRSQDITVKHQEHFNKNPNYPDRSQDAIVKNQNYPDRSHEISKKNQECYKNQNFPNKYQEGINTTNYRFVKHSKDESWNEDQHRKSNVTYQKHSDNINHQTFNHRKSRNQMQEMKFSNNFNQGINSNLQEDKKVTIEESVNPSGQMDVKNEKQNVNFNLSKNETNATEHLHTSHAFSDENGLRARRLLINTNENATRTTSDAMKKSESKQNTSTSVTCTNFNSIQEGLSPEQKPNVVMSFEGNQNVQRALGLNPNACNAARGANQQMDNNDIPNSNATDTAILSTQFNTSTDQNMPFTQQVPCVNYDVSMSPMNNAMNVNAPPFNNVNLAPNQRLNNQYSVGVDGAMPNAPFGFFPISNIDIDQLRMNEISNSSQKLLNLHNTVSTLSKQLASAQANLLAAQVKFYQDAVSCSANPQNQLVMQNQSQSLPDDFLSTKYSNLPSFQTPIPNIQKVQRDAHHLSNTFPTTNIQDFASESFHSNTPMEQRPNLQPMYMQPNHLYQHQPANFQQYSVNAPTINTIPRGRLLQQNSEEKELRGTGNQFYTH